ncbi:MAG: hypothetical protein H6816_07940 [Phycisphaerales bacterium]|nr:hypothetical protein [Phycisphaerales bacterium]
MLRDWVGELRRYGAPRETGDPRRGTVFLLDGVGGFKLTPLLVRKALRVCGSSFATYFYDWHRGLPGDMLSDLMCLRANRRAALKLARIIRRRAREFPDAPIHLISYSGGTGVAAFAVEKLGRHVRLGVLVLGASALAPGYDLAPVLRRVRVCYGLTSRRDVIILGLGTTLFGTVDRRFGASAGLVGFRNVPGSGGAGEPVGEFVAMPWTPELCAWDHAGHHVGAASVPYVRTHLVPLLGDAATA